jgi:hypothetical protein
MLTGFFLRLDPSQQPSKAVTTRHKGQLKVQSSKSIYEGVPGAYRAVLAVLRIPEACQGRRSKFFFPAVDDLGRTDVPDQCLQWFGGRTGAVP